MIKDASDVLAILLEGGTARLREDWLARFGTQDVNVSQIKSSGP